MTNIHPLIAATGIEHWQADCATCGNELRERMIAEGKLDWALSLSSPMWLCSECGNKRCPKATWHENECTHSNAPGQPGSSYVLLTPEQQAGARERFRQLMREIKEDNE